MKDINAILSNMGIEVPEDKQEELRKAVTENYKTVAEYNNKVKALEKAEKEAQEARDAITKFDGIDPDKVKDELEAYKKRAEEAETRYKKDAEARAFDEAAEKLLDGYTFSSNSAKAHTLSRLKESGLKVIDGMIMGGADYMTKLQQEDAEAFTKSDAPQFTTPNNSGGSGATMTKDKIMAIKDYAERQRAIADNIGLFRK